VFVAFGMMLGTACSTIGGAGELSSSPRVAVLEAVDRIEPVLDELTVLVSAGAISDNVVDDIAQFGPDVQKILAAYFDGAEACVSIGGLLQTETSVGRICSGNALNAIYDALDQQIWVWAIKTGLDTKTGQTIVAGRLVVKSVVRPAGSGPFARYRNEPDVPLADFQSMRARLKAKFETLIAAAQSRLASEARLSTAPAA